MSNGLYRKVISTALEASHIIKATKGTHYSTAIILDASAPGGTYYIQLLDAASVPADGAVTLLHTPIQVVHSAGTPDYFTIDDNPGGIDFVNGLVVVLSSTQFAKALSGPYLAIDSSVT